MVMENVVRNLEKEEDFDLATHGGTKIIRGCWEILKSIMP
jgi:hypothetical protein